MTNGVQIEYSAVDTLTTIKNLGGIHTVPKFMTSFVEWQQPRIPRVAKRTDIGCEAPNDYSTYDICAVWIYCKW